jgi:hypothetical protein
MHAFEQLVVSFGPAVVRQMILEECGGGVCLHCGGEGDCNCRGCIGAAGTTDRHGRCAVCRGSGIISEAASSKRGTQPVPERAWSKRRLG